ncbi:hypothetical protein SFRURICE_006440, partial [Spodoptera frugiperda]
MAIKKKYAAKTPRENFRVVLLATRLLRYTMAFSATRGREDAVEVLELSTDLIPLPPPTLPLLVVHAST